MSVIVVPYHTDEPLDGLSELRSPGRSAFGQAGTGGDRPPGSTGRSSDGSEPWHEVRLEPSAGSPGVQSAGVEGAGVEGAGVEGAGVEGAGQSAGPWAWMAELYDRVAAEVAVRAERGERATLVTGDCTTSLGVVAGLQRAGLEDVGVVWFDAHGDLHTPDSTASGYLGGMPLRMLLGAGDPTVAERVGLEALPETQVVLVDGRDLDPPERAYLSGARVRQLGVPDVRVDALPAGPLYLHVDVDVVDPAYVSGLRYPAPGGPTPQAVARAVRTVLASGRVHAVGLACTWQPEARDLAPIAELLAALLGPDRAPDLPSS